MPSVYAIKMVQFYVEERLRKAMQKESASTPNTARESLTSGYNAQGLFKDEMLAKALEALTFNGGTNNVPDTEDDVERNDENCTKHYDDKDDNDKGNDTYCDVDNEKGNSTGVKENTFYTYEYKPTDANGTSYVDNGNEDDKGNNSTGAKKKIFNLYKYKPTDANGASYVDNGNEDDKGNNSTGAKKKILNFYKYKPTDANGTSYVDNGKEYDKGNNSTGAKKKILNLYKYKPTDANGTSYVDNCNDHTESRELYPQSSGLPCTSGARMLTESPYELSDANLVENDIRSEAQEDITDCVINVLSNREYTPQQTLMEGLASAERNEIPNSQLENVQPCEMAEENEAKISTDDDDDDQSISDGAWGFDQSYNSNEQNASGGPALPNFLNLMYEAEIRREELGSDREGRPQNLTSVKAQPQDYQLFSAFGSSSTPAPVVMYRGRDILDLGANLRAGPLCTPTMIPLNEFDNFFQCRSLFHRLSFYFDEDKPIGEIHCGDCGFIIRVWKHEKPSG